jgi:hypothetical protein
MALFGRRRSLPGRHRPALERDERVMAWASTVGGDALVATNLGLWLPADEPARLADEPVRPAGGPARLGWHEIHKAVWNGEALAVTAARRVEHRPGYAVVADLPTVQFRLTDPGDLPSQVRARVTRSVGPSSHHPLPSSGGVRVAARRVPGVDGLTWTVRYDAGVDHDDPIVRELTAALVDQAREDVSV